MPRKSKYQDNISDKSSSIWKVALYIRLSREDEDEEEKTESNSVINQRAMLQDFLRNKSEFVIYDIYVDDGYSGTDFNRPGFQRLLNDMKENKFNTIIVKDLSRLGRNYIEVGNYIEQIFPLFKIRFISLNDMIDSHKDPTSVNNVIVPFKNLMNDEYCRDISMKIRSAFNTKKRNGDFVGAWAPYGYLKDPKNKYHLIIDEEVAYVVRMIFDLALQGYGRQTIAKRLNSLGIVNPTGYKQEVLKLNYQNHSAQKYGKDYAWTNTTISQILKNRVYIGDMVQCKEKVISYKVHKIVKTSDDEKIIVENTHEPIIDKEQFYKVQDIIFSRDTRVEKSGNLSIFAGHIRCGDCKRAMNKKTLSNKNRNRDYWYYICSTYRNKSKELCTKHSIRNDRLENAVLEAIKLQISLVLEMEDILNEINKSKTVNLRNNNIEISIKKQEAELEKNKKLKKSVYEDWKLGLISQEEYIEYSEEYLRNIKNIQETLNYLSEEKEQYKEQMQSENSWITVFKKNKNISELSKQVIDELVDCIYIYENERITVSFKFDDEYKNALNYIKENEELAQNIVKAV